MSVKRQECAQKLRYCNILSKQLIPCIWYAACITGQTKEGNWHWQAYGMIKADFALIQLLLNLFRYKVQCRQLRKYWVWVFFCFCFFESAHDSCVSMSAGALKCRGWHVYNTSLPNLTSSLQVPQDEWSNFSPLGKDDEIPCRRMRSGSYIKAMAEEDSGDSDCSPKPSPKVQARRASYLKATQPSLTEMTTLKWVCTRAQIITWNYSL